MHINCSVVLFCYFRLNGVNCCAFAWKFLSTPKSLGGITDGHIIISHTVMWSYTKLHAVANLRGTKGRRPPLWRDAKSFFFVFTV